MEKKTASAPDFQIVSAMANPMAHYYGIREGTIDGAEEGSLLGINDGICVGSLGDAFDGT